MLTFRNASNYTINFLLALERIDDGAQVARVATEDALGMELEARDGKGAVLHRFDDAVI